jgi:FtsX-like permease family
MVPSPHSSACFALAAADHRKDAQVNQVHDHGRVREHAAMTGSRRQAAGAVAPARGGHRGGLGVRPPGGRWSSRCGVSIGHLGERWGWGPLSPGIQQAAVARDRALLEARDVAILKVVGMSPRQLLAMVLTARAVLGVMGGLVALSLGVRAYHGLMTQLARQVGNRPPPFEFDVLHPRTLYPLGVIGLAIAGAGVVSPALRAARSPAAVILRSE